MGRHRRGEEIPIARPDPRAPVALYAQLVQSIETAIRAGQLRVGQRLPAERDLATRLGVSRTTVTGAYQELEARGLLRGHVGRGTIVVAAPADTVRTGLPWAQRASPLAVQAAQLWFGIPRDHPDVVTLDTGWPDPKLYPLEPLGSLMQGLLSRDSADLYGAAPPVGDTILRQTLSHWLASRGIETDPDAILITTGAQQGLNVLARAFLSPGDVVVTENPTFQCALVAFRWAGADVVGVPGDREGIQPDALEEVLARHRPKLIYLIPTFHNPTGTVLTRERRRRVLDLAARYRVPVVESDLYGEIFFDDAPPPSLRALDQAGFVIYQGSFSKIAVPGLRVGWLVAPPGAMVPLIAAKGYQDLHTAALMQRLAAAFMESPHLERHLSMLRTECRARRDRLVAALRQHCPRLTFRIPSGGYYLWAQLPHPLTTEQLLPAASEAGVAVRPGPQFTPDGAGEDHVRLCFAALEPARIVEGARRLGEAVEKAGRRLEGPRRRTAAAAVSVV